jgi:hypothetical protein
MAKRGGAREEKVMAEKLPILERLETFWEQHNQRLNTIIGKLSVGAAVTREAHTLQSHHDLIDFAHWVDEQMEGLDET